MTTPTLGWIPRVILSTAVAFGLQGCQKRELASFGASTTPLGRRFEVPAGRGFWVFPAKPGQKFRVELEWPDAELDIKAGSDWRDKGEEDGDDGVKFQTLGEVQSDGPHRWVINWTIGPKANTGFFGFGLRGRGVHPISVKIDRD
jgi:hypothetical protein